MYIEIRGAYMDKVQCQIMQNALTASSNSRILKDGQIKDVFMASLLVTFCVEDPNLLSYIDTMLNDQEWIAAIHNLKPYLSVDIEDCLQEFKNTIGAYQMQHIQVDYAFIH